MKNLKKGVLAVLCQIISFSGYSQSQLLYANMQTRWAKKVDNLSPLNEYPNPQLERSNWINLNGIWQYQITKKDAQKPATFEGKILVPYPIESSLSGVKKMLLPTELLWYKRMITKPAITTGERVILHFGAVDWQAIVYLNGKEIGSHTGGYTAFSFDITENLKSGNNELIVKVYDPTDKGIGPHGKQVLNPANIYYTPSSGIWQTVWMETIPANYIQGLIIVPDIDRSVVNVTVNSATYTDVKLMVADKTISGKSNTVISMQINNVREWSPDDPYLYDLTVTLGKDKVKSYFGMRKISIGKDEKGFDRIMLNNKYTYNLGTLDQGFWPDGLYTAPTDEALQFDIKAIKSMGFNTIRKHIKVEPARWYYHADRLGMLVWQDLVNPNQGLPAGAKEAFEKESAEIVKQLRNYPSITTWVLFNEKWGQYDQERLTKWLNQADPSRLVNGHSGEYLYVNKQLRSPSPNAYIGADMTDVHAYPNPMMPIKLQGKVQVLGEFGGIGVPIEGHLWDDLTAGWGYDGILTPAKMKIQYSQMIDSLVKLEKQGLSASIYTQPFDVESEQNGIMTYDREVIKIAPDDLRRIHAKLVPQYVGSGLAKESVTVADSTVKDYAERLKEYQNGNRDSAFLRGFAIMAKKQKDKNIFSDIVNDYVSQSKDLFRIENIKFVKRFTYKTSDRGFDILFNNSEKIDSLLGVDASLSTLTATVERSEIIPFAPDWDKIETSLQKYGELGRETLLQYQVLYAVNNHDWKLFSEVADAWFTKYGIKRSWITAFLLNNIAWATFQECGDPIALEAAVNMSQKAIEKEPTANYYDTYANLLYKLGRKDEAIKIEEKALTLEPGNGSVEDVKKALKNMRAGLPTWPTQEKQ